MCLYMYRTVQLVQVLARHCGLVVYMAFSHEVRARLVADWELYFGAFFKFLTISGRVATVVEIYQFVLNS